MTPALPRIGALALLALGLAVALPAGAGDDDKPPAYKIYIDPETGKYTTEEPGVQANEPRIIQPAVDAASEVSSSGFPVLVVIAGAAAVLLAGGLIRHQMRHNH